MKKNILGWMAIALMAFMCVGFAACGGSGDDDNGSRGGGNLSELQIRESLEYGTGTWSITEINEDGDVIHYTMTFKDGTTNGYSHAAFVPYSVSANYIYIDSEYDNVLDFDKLYITNLTNTTLEGYWMDEDEKVTVKGTKQ